MLWSTGLLSIFFCGRYLPPAIISFFWAHSILSTNPKLWARDSSRFSRPHPANVHNMVGLGTNRPWIKAITADAKAQIKHWSDWMATSENLGCSVTIAMTQLKGLHLVTYGCRWPGRLGSKSNFKSRNIHFDQQNGASTKLDIGIGAAKVTNFDHQNGGILRWWLVKSSIFGCETSQRPVASAQQHSTREPGSVTREP